MRDYALSFMKEIGFDGEATASLIGDLDKIYGEPRARKIFEKYIALYDENISIDFGAMLKEIETAASPAGVHVYSAKLLIYVCLSKRLRQAYAERGVSDTIWYDSMCDLKWKLWECQAVKGVHGSFVAEWFYRFFDMTRFALGRLQFEMNKLPCDCVFKGKEIKQGETAISIHIPRTLTPLTREETLKSYRMAIDMFGKEFAGKPVIFACHSWLLSEEVIPMLKAGSNIKTFVDDFEIVFGHKNKEGDHPDAWRLFDTDFTGDVESLPENTSLRRAYKSYIRSGGVTGEALGLFLAKDVLGE